ALGSTLNTLGLPTSSLLDPVEDAGKPASAEWIEEVLSSLPAPAAHLGLALAEVTPSGTWGVLDYFMMTSACLRDALRRIVRYQAVLFPSGWLTLLEDERAARLVLRPTDSDPTTLEHLPELLFGVIALRARQAVCGRLRLSSVRFAHSH